MGRGGQGAVGGCSAKCTGIGASPATSCSASAGLLLLPSRAGPRPQPTLRPLSTQPPSTRRAVVCSADASLPLEGSVRAQHPTFLRGWAGGRRSSGAGVMRHASSDWCMCTQSHTLMRAGPCRAALGAAPRGKLPAPQLTAPVPFCAAPCPACPARGPSVRLPPAAPPCPALLSSPPSLEVGHIWQQLPLLLLAAQQAHCKGSKVQGAGVGRRTCGNTGRVWQRGSVVLGGSGLAGRRCWQAAGELASPRRTHRSGWPGRSAPGRKWSRSRPRAPAAGGGPQGGC